jgi:hypothetical protein
MPSNQSFCANASIPEHPGSKKYELKRSVTLFKEVANRSQYIFPKAPSIRLITYLFMVKLSPKGTRDSLSATRLSFDLIYYTTNVAPLSSSILRMSSKIGSAAFALQCSF